MSIRKLVTLDEATLAAVDTFRRSGQIARRCPRCGGATESTGLPSEAETLRQLIEDGLEWRRRRADGGGGV